MSSVVLSIDSRELSRFLDKINRFSKDKQEAVKKEVARATLSIQAKAKQNTAVFKKPTGFLTNRIDAVIKNKELTGQVISKAKYGLFVHEGTRPHLIMPKNKKVLAWRNISYTAKGRRKYSAWNFAMAVKHPGTKAIPYLAKAADSERPIYQQNLITIFSK